MKKNAFLNKTEGSLVCLNGIMGEICLFQLMDRGQTEISCISTLKDEELDTNKRLTNSCEKG
jgi:hypothetical protein